jgi:carbamoyl-phosphate synthase large subunit
MNREREHVDWQLVKQLKGRNYSWTSLWNNGELITSVLKERLEWVYNRIGTTAVNCTVNDLEVNKYCESIVNVLRDKFDSKLSGIMMIDLMEDIDDGKFYVTECNAGRLGTVNYNYGLWSREVFGDDRLNFPYLLYKIAIDEVLPYPFKKFDPLPPDIYYIRHIDMGYKNIYP